MLPKELSDIVRSDDSMLLPDYFVFAFSETKMRTYCARAALLAAAELGSNNVAEWLCKKMVSHTGPIMCAAYKRALKLGNKETAEIICVHREKWLRSAA